MNFKCAMFNITKKRMVEMINNKFNAYYYYFFWREGAGEGFA
jgi:hypothetical protein